MDTSVDQLFKDREEAQQAPILEETTSGTVQASRPEKKNFSVVLIRVSDPYSFDTDPGF